MRHPAASRPLSLWIRFVFLLVAILLLLITPGGLLAEENEDAMAAYIVKGTSAARMAELVANVGGTVTHQLKIIRAVGARLTDAQRNTLADHPDVSRIWVDRQTRVDDKRQERD